MNNKLNLNCLKDKGNFESTQEVAHNHVIVGIQARVYRKGEQVLSAMDITEITAAILKDNDHYEISCIGPTIDGVVLTFKQVIP